MRRQFVPAVLSIVMVIAGGRAIASGWSKSDDGQVLNVVVPAGIGRIYVLSQRGWN